MITFNRRTYRLASVKAKRGFTLIEVVISMSLASLASLAIFPTFVAFVKCTAGAGNYVDMSRSSRSGLEIISRDLHAAESMVEAKTDEMTVTLPADLDNAKVTYKYDKSLKTLTRTSTLPDGSQTARELFDDVDEFKLVYYNRLGVDIGNSPSILSQAKSVQINAKLVKDVITVETSDYIISARFLMRNK